MNVMTEVVESPKILKVFPSFILGKCRCGCNEEIPIRNTMGRLQEYKYIHRHRGIKHWAFNYGIHHHVKGYLEIYIPDHPNATKLGYILAHRLFMSLALGRPLEKDEDVHHIDGDIYNNAQSNLQLIKHGEHSTLTGFAKTDGRICYICRTDKTYVKKNGWRVWATYKDGWLCHNCSRKIIRRLKHKN